MCVFPSLRTRVEQCERCSDAGKLTQTHALHKTKYTQDVEEQTLTLYEQTSGFRPQMWAHTCLGLSMWAWTDVMIHTHIYAGVHERTTTDRAKHARMCGGYRYSLKNKIQRHSFLRKLPHEEKNSKLPGVYNCPDLPHGGPHRAAALVTSAAWLNHSTMQLF